MKVLKRFIRPGLLISIIGHLAALALGLVFVGAHSFEAPPPPEAMVVDIVPPDEAPRLQGTPSALTKSGSQLNAPNSAAQSQLPKSPKQPQQAQNHSEPQRNATQLMTPQAARADLTSAEIVKEKIEQVQPPPEKTPDQPDAAETIARYALAGGPLGGGFNAPPIDASMTGYDFTAEFRERVSTCSSLPAGIMPDEKISVAMRVLLNRDGTLAAPPQPLEPIVSEKQQALMANSIGALERCQPYTMLPADKYQQWKKLDLTFFPIGSLGR